MIININSDKKEIKTKLLFKLNLLSSKLTLFDFLELDNNIIESKFDIKFIPIKDTKNIFDLIKNEIINHKNYIILNNADYLSNDPISTINFFENLKDMITNTILFVISNESLVIGNANVSYLRIRNEDQIEEFSSVIYNIMQHKLIEN